ncbi:MAG: hypothetical protein H6739_17845 [Alphaproteobacteria bacterium]|nr:hypothetical protein [Alphaproteobacteria bacterium]
MTPAELIPLKPARLSELLCAGHPIDPTALDDTRYRGVSLGLPGFVVALTWRTFIKTFHRDPATGALRGWNVRLEQTGLDGEVVYKTDRRGQPVTFGHYRVVGAEGYRVPWDCAQGLVIDYGLGGNPALELTDRLRDPLVALKPDSVELLLGVTWVDLGPLQLRTPAYFALERLGGLDAVVPVPRPERAPSA